MTSNRACTARRAAAALFLALGLAGCLGKGGSSTHYYLVDPVASPAPAAPQPLAIEVMDLHVPQYLERFQVATRTGDNGIVYAEYHQWGEALRKNLLRTLARNLSALLGTVDVSTPLNRSLARPDFRLQVHIDQFEQDMDGVVRLKARWQILDTHADGSAPVTDSAEFESEQALDKGDYAAVIAAMTALYGQLSQRIAGGIGSSAPPGAQQ